MYNMRLEKPRCNLFLDSHISLLQAVVGLNEEELLEGQFCSGSLSFFIRLAHLLAHSLCLIVSFPHFGNDKGK